MKVNALYLAVEGEGIRIGTPQIFLRLQGCQHHCPICDSQETWPLSGSTYTIQELIQKINKLSQHKIKYLSITGGDILLQEKELSLLLSSLRKKFFINLEASHRCSAIFDLANFISFDIKAPSSLCSKIRPSARQVHKWQNNDLANLIYLIKNCAGKFQIKTPVLHQADIRYISSLHKKIKAITNYSFTWIITPVIQDKIDLAQIQMIYRHFLKQDSFRVILQQHKLIFPLHRKNV